STLRTSKIVSKYAKIEEFEAVRYYPGSSNPKLEGWCRKEAARFGVTIDDDAIAYLLESTEADLRKVSKEIENASIHVLPDKKITGEIISRLASHQAHAFSLLDHWAMGNRFDALKDLAELLARQSGIPIIALLNTSLSKWVNIKAAEADLVQSAKR